MFLGGDAHRVQHKNTRYNRYFDVLIEKYNIQEQSMYFEYGNQEQKNQFQPENVFFYETFYSYFQHLYRKKKQQVNFQWDGFSLFKDFLLSNELTHDFIQKNDIPDIENWAQKQFLPKIAFFTSVLKEFNRNKFIFCVIIQILIMPCW